MLGLKLNHVSKRGHWCLTTSAISGGMTEHSHQWLMTNITFILLYNYKFETCLSCTVFFREFMVWNNETIDLEKLIQMIDTYYGKAYPLKWFSSYLKGGVQSVQIGYTFSREKKSFFLCSPRLSSWSSAFRNVHNPSWQHYPKARVNISPIC